MRFPLIRLIVGLLLTMTFTGPPPTVVAQQDTSGLERLEQLQEQFSSEGPQPNSSGEIVHITRRLDRTEVRPGSSFKAVVLLEIQDGWHVNAHQPGLDYLIGTVLDTRQHADLMRSGITYPEPERLSLAFAGEELAVYGGTVPIFLSLRTSEDLEPGTYTLQNTLAA